MNDDNAEMMKKNTANSITSGLNSNMIFNVIGYNLNDKEVFCSKINFADLTENKKYQQFMFLSEILEKSAKIKEKEKIEVEKTATIIPFLKKSIANASSVQVEATMDINTAIYGFFDSIYLKIGNLNTDWILFQDYNENDPTYDRFTIKTNYEVEGFNNFFPYTITPTHDITYSVDQIEDWGPDDYTGLSTEITVSVPWSLSYMFSPISSYDINECGSQTNDYGKWIVDPVTFGLALNITERFCPSTAWLFLCCN